MRIKMESGRFFEKMLKKQRVIPHAVGRKKARAVHFQLPVSFLMVKQVVPQGKCIREKIMTHRAVTQVQP